MADSEFREKKQHPPDIPIHHCSMFQNYPVNVRHPRSCVDLHDDATNTPNVLKDGGFCFLDQFCESSDEVLVWKW